MTQLKNTPCYSTLDNREEASKEDDRIEASTQDIQEAASEDRPDSAVQTLQMAPGSLEHPQD